ncbi:MAG: autotransporter outer membrane beta-barrel domain-containing protein [Puniceicoccales bacterium]|jgi:hypothetical protein|nr:autotransporter outer membrane beta-barrel domain-containing protein [Puniceicoccales bacterium]
MKEKNEKMDVLANRNQNHWLKVLGLGFTFLGAAYPTRMAAAKEYKPDKDVQAEAGKDAKNIWTFEANGNLGTTPADESIFVNKGDHITLPGKGTDGKESQFIRVLLPDASTATLKFGRDGTHEINNGLKDLLVKDGELNKLMVGTTANFKTDNSFARALHRAAAKKYANAIGKACEEAAATLAASPQQAAKAIGETITKAKTPDTMTQEGNSTNNLTTLLANQASITNAWADLCAIAKVVVTDGKNIENNSNDRIESGNFFEKIADNEADESLAGANIDDVPDLSSGSKNVNQTLIDLAAFLKGITGSSLTQADLAGALAVINTKLTPPSSSSPSDEVKKLMETAAAYTKYAGDINAQAVTLDAAANVSAAGYKWREVVAELHGAEAGIESACAALKDMYEYILPPDEANALEKYKNGRSDDPGNNLIAQAYGKFVFDDIEALFSVDPTSKFEGHRLWTFQLTDQREATSKGGGTKDPLGEADKPAFLKINPANLTANDTVFVSFENGDLEKDSSLPLKIGDIVFRGLDKDLNLTLMNALNLKNAAEIKGQTTVQMTTSASIWDILDPSSIGTSYQHLTLQLFRQHKSRTEANPYDFDFQTSIKTPIAVKKLVLGMSKKEDRNLKWAADHNGQTTLASLPEVQQNYPVSALFHEVLIVGADVDGIQVQGDSRLAISSIIDTSSGSGSGSGKAINVAGLALGGKISFAEGPSTTLTLGGDVAGTSLLIVPFQYDNNTTSFVTADGKNHEIEITSGQTLALSSGIIFPAIEVGTDIIKETSIEDFCKSIIKPPAAAPTKSMGHSYISLSGGTMESPSSLYLQGQTLTLLGGKDLPKDATINGETTSALIVVGENAYAKIVGHKDKSVGALVLKDTASDMSLISLKKGATLLLDPIILNAGEKYVAIDAPSDSTIQLITGHTVELIGNIKTTTNNLKLIFLLPEGETMNGNNPALKWTQGNIVPESATIQLGIDISSLVKQYGLNEVANFIQDCKDSKAANPFSIDFGANNDRAKALAERFSKEMVGTKLPGLKLAFENGKLVFDFKNAVIPRTIQSYLGDAFDWTYISNGFRDYLNSAASKNGNDSTDFEEVFRDYLFSDLDVREKSKAISNLNKTTTEEKHQATFAIVENIQESVYTNMAPGLNANHHYSLWGSAFGDLVRSGRSSSYKMNCDVFGFIVGIDSYLTNNFLIGLCGGYGKAKAKYKGDMIFKSDESNKCDVKSYFGGVYGMLDDYVTDLTTKFIVAAGRGKYEEAYALPSLMLPPDLAAGANPNTSDYTNTDTHHGGHWIAANIDLTYKHWNYYGIDAGPWLSLSLGTVHQKSNSTVFRSSTVADCKLMRSIESANRRSIAPVIGMVLSYDFNLGNFELGFGYKHDFRHLTGGKVTLSMTDNAGRVILDDEKNTPEYCTFNASGISTGKNAFVARAALNMKFNNNFGLSLGGHGQIGNNLKSIAGTITASYSF